MISIIQIWENKVAVEAPIRPYIGINNKFSPGKSRNKKYHCADYTSLLGNLQIIAGDISEYLRKNLAGELVELLNASIK